MRISLNFAAMAAILAAAMLSVGPAIAAPLKPKDVAADAKWVMHVDFDSMRESQLGGVFREKCLATDDAQKRVKRFQEDTGVDPAKDMHSVTLYDTKFVEHSGVAIFRASNIDGKKLLVKLKEKHPDHKSEKHGSVTVYTWTEGKGKKHEHQVSGAMLGRDTILFSRDTKQLTAALDVLAGKSASLSADSPLAESAPKGTFVLARGIGMDKEKTPFRADVIRRSKQLSIAMGQQGNEVFMQGLLAAPNADSAAKVREVVEGFRALAQLRFGDRDHADKMLRGLNIAVAGSTVVMEWKGNGDDVAKMMVKHHEQMQKWRKHREKEGAKGEKGKLDNKDGKAEAKKKDDDDHDHDHK